ncbi:Protein-export membrane protein SecF [Candidatus Cyrtobacter comes]|uniref:Protein-export membrane protein SecF n=1 Tax=Candidatus Cyrtobacter comes TaxID=675776 RepID=A0ABU5L6H1_9RICK|nr:protein translocase subunit SecF [Candidatus Cyrtobacter comes]MDZ5761716.1 Protein-export membrane protein SecF [Candidatus Cyrtobacter comes]
MNAFLISRGSTLGLSFNFVKFRRLSYIFAIIVSLCVPICLFLRGVNFGIDFLGGVVVEARSDKDIKDIEYIRSDFEKLAYKLISIDVDSSNNLILRAHIGKIDKFEDELRKNFDYLKIDKIDFVGPKLGVDMLISAASGVLIAIIAMVVYISMRFTRRFGMSMGITLFHDLMGAILFYSVTQYEFNASSVAALLTILGYSVNDSVVIFDRIRENSARHYKMRFDNVVNLSLNETLSRTTITALTTLLSCVVLFVFGGASLQGFAGAMIFGVLFGTYSSIFISAPLVLTLSTKLQAAIKKR